MPDTVITHLSQLQARVREELFIMDVAATLSANREYVLDVMDESFRRIRALSDEALEVLPRPD